MTRTLLVTTGNGMFGRALIEQLLGNDQVRIRAMVRDRAAFTLQAPNLEVVVGDMDRPESLLAPVTGVSHVFLTSPMDDHIAAREKAVIDAAAQAGGAHIIDIAGAVQHHGDALSTQHEQAIDHLKRSGLPWTLVSPNSVMETSLNSFADQIPMGVVMGMSGHGRIGLVALVDVARVLAAVVITDGHEGQDYRCTGPEALDMPSVVAQFADVLDRSIEYVDLPEDEFAKMMLEHAGYTDRQALDTEVLCHLRAWREGGAELVTDTVADVTGSPAMPLREWIELNRARFSAHPSLGERIAGVAVRAQYRRYRMEPQPQGQ